MKKHNSKHENKPIDVSKLTTLEDLILAAMGPPDKNIVNFKMVQAILMILAQQLRMLERPVDYRSLVEDKTAQSDKDNAKRVGGEEVKAGKEDEKSEREDEKSESDRKGETAERDSHKPERDRGKREKTERDSGKEEKSERAREKSISDRGKEKKAETASDKLERDRGIEKKTEAASKKSEKDGGKGKKADTASEKSERGNESSVRESELSHRESEISHRESEISQRASEISQREREDSEREKTEQEKDKTEIEKEKTESEKKKTKREKEVTGSETETGKKGREREKETTEIEGEKREMEKDKRDPQKEETGPEREKEPSEPEKEKKKQIREKADPVREKEKKERESAKTGPAREKETTEPEKEKKKQIREKADPVREKEKKERESAKTGPAREKEKKRRETEEKEKIIPSKETMIEESFISITDKDKVLVVEKLPASRQRDTIQSRVGSISVVTLSQFKLLEAAVKALEEKASPIPFPSMPDNQTLRDEIAKGSVSLTDTMQAMQVSARVQAAEEAINRMAGLLTDMAAKGAVPDNVSGGIQHFTADTKEPESRKRAPSVTSKAVDKPAKQPFMSTKQPPRSAMREPQIPLNFVTHPELYEALRGLKEDLTLAISANATNAQKIAEASLKTVNNAVQKAEASKGAEALKAVEDHFENITKSLDYATEKLANTTSTANSQMDTFNTTLALLRTDLQEGTSLFKSIDNGSESQAICDINEKYGQLMEMLDMMMESHKQLATGHHQLNGDLQNILTCLEILQEEKSDRDEMLDRLRDKADICALDDLLPTQTFAMHFEILDDKLDRCHGKFERQEAVWQKALDELAMIADSKSELLQLIKLKEETENQLNDINKKLRCLVFALGEPKAALLARQLSLGGRCGACSKPAIQEIIDKSYIKDADEKLYSKPSRLPAAYFSYLGAGDPCEVKTNPLSTEEAKHHVCKRWVGGSHTLINASVKHVEPAPMEAFEPTKKFCGYGNDGRLYNMEQPLDPCEHCSPQSDEEMQVDGAGDTDHMVHVHMIGGPRTTDK